MAKLIDVIRDPKRELERKQLPLMIDEKLTVSVEDGTEEEDSMVMDIREVDYMCQCPTFRGKEKESFLKKFILLGRCDLKKAFQVDCKRILDIVREIVPCVGCRRSVERLFHQLKTGQGRFALYPLLVTSDGELIIAEELYETPNTIGAMFHNHVTKLYEISAACNRSKKSSRCILHSLDAQRYVRPPLGPGWKIFWDCLVPFCKREVATIDVAHLLTTLETYLQKHRFCTECRTKVMKAYDLLVEDPDEGNEDGSNCEANVCPLPCEHNHSDHASGDEHSRSGTTVKEKGFIPSLYAGIRKCPPNNHIHVDQTSEYITGLILAAEPELLGNRRERHAKTLEIAQEEVLVCVGLCLYERVHRIQLRLREEQTTCQLLALVAINALSTNFELAVEMKQGVSQMDLLFEEFNRKDRLKERRKEVRKLKKKKKKERKNAAVVVDSRGDIEDDVEKDCNHPNDLTDQRDEDESDDELDDNEIVQCLIEKDKKHAAGDGGCNIKPFFRTNENSSLENIIDISNHIYLEDKEDDDSCPCSISFENSNSSPTKTCRQENRNRSSLVEPLGQLIENRISKMIPGMNFQLPKTCVSPTDRVTNDFSDTCSTSSSGSIYSKYNDKDNTSHSCEVSGDNGISNNTNNVAKSNEAIVDPSCDCCINVQNDCGYGSADNKSISCSSGSSGESSNDSSEVACSEGFCNHEGTEDCNFDLRQNSGGEVGGNVERKWAESEDCRYDVPQNDDGETGGNVKRDSPNQDRTNNDITKLCSASLIGLFQQMLKEEVSEKELETTVDQNTCVSPIPQEEIMKYKSRVGWYSEKREKLRRELRSRFAEFVCSSQQQAKALPTI